MNRKVKIFTDGSCLGNPGPGGYGVILRYKEYERIFSNGYYLTTNNRMELMAIIVGLESLRTSCEVILYTDSMYVLRGINRWIDSWKRQNWKNSKKKLIKNVDLWKRLDIAISYHILQWNWVKGHNKNQENHRCDRLAKFAANSPLFEDLGYLNKW